MISEDKIQEATKRLVEAYDPVAIYLFGSYAWGEPNEDSDLDLMVILSDSSEVVFSTHKKGKLALRDLKIDNDLIVANKHYFDKTASKSSTLEYKIKNEGKRLYGTL